VGDCSGREGKKGGKNARGRRESGVKDREGIGRHKETKKKGRAVPASPGGVGVGTRRKRKKKRKVPRPLNLHKKKKKTPHNPHEKEVRGKQGGETVRPLGKKKEREKGSVLAGNTQGRRKKDRKKQKKGEVHLPMALPGRQAKGGGSGRRKYSFTQQKKACFCRGRERKRVEHRGALRGRYKKKGEKGNPRARRGSRKRGKKRSGGRRLTKEREKKRKVTIVCAQEGKRDVGKKKGGGCVPRGKKREREDSEK